ncbi:hypothetical protein [Chryseobacterium oranimense]|uniref:hypothetical protein n=1 Tax=Chryseobacterium oranimense TaxID=421058 RepID=UPI0031D93FF7
MIENLETLSSFLTSLLPFSCAIALIGLFIAMLTRLFKNVRVTVIGIVLFAQIFILALLLIIVQNMMAKNIRNEILGILADPKTKIIVNYNDFGSLQPEELKKELSKLKDIPTNHSHPTEKKTIPVISAAGNFNLLIAQDSNDAKEFWIFTDKYQHSEETEVGKIITSNIKLENVNTSD